MRRLLWIFILIPFATRAQQPDEKKVYDFLNQFLDSMHGGYILFAEPDTESVKNVFWIDRAAWDGPRYLTKQDSIEIVVQVHSRDKFRFNGKLLYHTKVASRDSDWEPLLEKLRIPGHRTLSVPIFYDHGKKAVLYQEAFIGSDGGGAIFIYELVAGKWLMRRAFTVWVT